MNYIRAKVESKIEDVNYEKISDRTTTCLITMESGFEIVGVSHCVNTDKFDYEVGKKFAYEDAMTKLFMAEAYHVKEIENNCDTDVSETLDYSDDEDIWDEDEDEDACYDCDDYTCSSNPNYEEEEEEEAYEDDEQDGEDWDEYYWDEYYKEDCDEDECDCDFCRENREFEQVVEEKQSTKNELAYTLNDRGQLLVRISDLYPNLTIKEANVIIDTYLKIKNMFPELTIEKAIEISKDYMNK